MKSSFDFKYDFSEEMNGYVLENSNLSKDNQKVKLYIPSVGIINTTMYRYGKEGNVLAVKFFM